MTPTISPVMMKGTPHNPGPKKKILMGVKTTNKARTATIIAMEQMDDTGSSFGMSPPITTSMNTQTRTRISTINVVASIIKMSHHHAGYI